MGKTLGYMITWTTYGTWLRGDERGWREDGKIYEGEPELKQLDESQMKGEAIRLNSREKAIVKEAIFRKAESRGQKIFAILVWSNHIHAVVGYDGRSIEETVRIYKNTATAALRKNGFTGKVWGGGYDKKYCFDEVSLKNRIEYVKGHPK